jgi:uncharacterized iron-regulated membrane protein
VWTNAPNEVATCAVPVLVAEPREAGCLSGSYLRIGPCHVAAVVTIAVGAATASHHGSTVSVGAVIAIGVGAATVAAFALAALTYWITQRRVRPIVICHEQRRDTSGAR